MLHDRDCEKVIRAELNRKRKVYKDFGLHGYPPPGSFWKHSLKSKAADQVPCCSFVILSVSLASLLYDNRSLQVWDNRLLDHDDAFQIRHGLDRRTHRFQSKKNMRKCFCIGHVSSATHWNLHE